MTLSNAIQSIPGWESKTNTELLEAVQAITVSTTDSQLYTYAGLAFKFPDPAMAIGLRATIKSVLAANVLSIEAQAALDFAHSRLEGPGIDLSLDFVQAQLTAMEAIPQLAPFIPTLKSTGVQVSNPYALATLPQVADTKAELLFEAKRSDWRKRFDAALNQLGTVEEAQGIAAIQVIASEVAG